MQVPDIAHLDPMETSRRLKAARILRGLKQTDLARLFDEDRLNETDPGKIERGEVRFTRAHLDACVRHLCVPERWFLADTVDEIVGYIETHAGLELLRAGMAVALEQLSRLEAQVAALDAEALGRIEGELRTIRESLPPPPE